jgi:hypothetical protein
VIVLCKLTLVVLLEIVAFSLDDEEPSVAAVEVLRLQSRNIDKQSVNISSKYVVLAHSDILGVLYVTEFVVEDCRIGPTPTTDEALGNIVAETSRMKASVDSLGVPPGGIFGTFFDILRLSWSANLQMVSAESVTSSLTSVAAFFKQIIKVRTFWLRSQSLNTQ